MVSSSSITGKKSSFSKGQIQYFNRINNLDLKNPKLIGFGISDKMTFESACNYSNGAIIGTSFIKALSDINIKDSIKNFVQNIGPTKKVSHHQMNCFQVLLFLDYPHHYHSQFSNLVLN